jgi:hypothetical protein
MAAAILTPRVRQIVICDTVKASRIETGVFDLRGVRNQLATVSFPFKPRRLWLYLLLSSPRKGDYPGYVVIINDRTGKAIVHSKFTPSFREEFELLPVLVRLRCKFPEPGRYTIQICFFQAATVDVVKGEQPFYILEEAS